MKIEKIINNDEALIKLEGRLDTNSAPMLEKEIESLTDVKKVIFDFEKLEYISSSGLRVVLKCKKMIDATKIINCNSDVFEVFSMTGFSQMMDIEKALRKISIDGLEKIGEGFFGTIYRLDDETIVKVYKVKDAIDMIKREKMLAKKAFVMGVPTAISYDIVKVGDLYGAIFELLNAKSIVDMVKKPEELDNFAKKSADILLDMHQKEVDTSILPSRKQVVKTLLSECEDYFSVDVFEKLKKLLDSIKETNTMLHCDFHVKNIMKQNDELLLIDMDTLSYGHPIFEFASMFATYEGFACVDKKNTDKFLGIPLDITKQIFDKTFGYYYSDKTYEELEEMKIKLSVISYIQILYLRVKYPDDNCPTVKEDIEFSRKYLTEKAKELDTLDF